MLIPEWYEARLLDLKGPDCGTKRGLGLQVFDRRCLELRLEGL